MLESKSSAPVEFLLDAARQLEAAPHTAQLVPFARHLRVAFHGPRRGHRQALDADLVSFFSRLFSLELRFTRLDPSLLALRFDQLTYLSYHELPPNRTSGTIMLFRFFHCMPKLKSLLLIEVSDGGYGKLRDSRSPSLSASNMLPPFQLRYYHYHGSGRFPFWHIPVMNSASTLQDLTIRLTPGGSFDSGQMECISTVCANLRRLVLEGYDSTIFMRGRDVKLQPSAIRYVVAQCARLQFLILLPTNWRTDELEHIARFVLDASPPALRVLELGRQLSHVLVERLAREYSPGAENLPDGLRALRLLILDCPTPGEELDAILRKFASRRVRVLCFHMGTAS